MNDFDLWIEQMWAEQPLFMTAIIAFLIWAIWCIHAKKEGQTVKQSSQGFLDQVLGWWDKFNPFTVTDLLRSLAIFGASGSGKTSGSGFFIGKALARCKQVSLLILASKPEDRAFWQGIFAKAGRGKDLLIFSPDSGLRFNCLDFVQRMGGETKDITQTLMMVKETIENNDSSGRSDDSFWRKEQERLTDNTVTIMRLVNKVNAPDMAKFINGAAMKPDDTKDEKWLKGFHNQTLKTAAKGVRNQRDNHDYVQALEYWLKEVPSMADKMRSGFFTGVLGTLHVFNQGVIRELMSTNTNVSPELFEHGKSLLIDMPIGSCGVGGAFVLGAWQYSTQWYILRRQVNENSPVIVCWSDEHQKVMNSFCGQFLAECRSHRGCMVTLTQSIHSYYTRLRQGGEHEADSYLTNFYHKIFHALGDAKTASYAGSLIGRRLTTHMGGSSQPSESAYDAIFGQSKFSANFSQNMENILESTAFMQNLRAGGRQNGYMVDGVVVRSGQTFANGEAYLKVAFNQKD